MNKPKFGHPCNGCGECCRVSLCDVGEQYFHGSPAPCPALEFKDNRMFCGLLTSPSKVLGMPFNADHYLSIQFSKLIPIGQGCGMEDDEGKV